MTINCRLCPLFPITHLSFDAILKFVRNWVEKSRGMRCRHNHCRGLWSSVKRGKLVCSGADIVSFSLAVKITTTTMADRHTFSLLNYFKGTSQTAPVNEEWRKLHLYPEWRRLQEFRTNPSQKSAKRKGFQKHLVLYFLYCVLCKSKL